MLMGTLAGGAPLLCVTVPLAILNLFGSQHDISASLYLAVLPLLVTFAFVLPASICIGIPVYLALKRFNSEGRDLYVLLGLAFGAALPLAVLLSMRAPQGYWLCFVGAGSGAVTGGTWWASRRRG